MGHLTREDLARIVSEEPSSPEWEHLEFCPVCQSELMALKEQTDAMGALPDLRPPPGDWEALEARLASEGLIRTSGLALRTSRFRTSGWFQAAAALVLFLGGTALGSRGAAEPTGDPVAVRPAGSESALIPASVQVPTANTLDDALRIRNLTERHFRDALVQYRQLYEAQGQPSYDGDPTSRLVALQAMIAGAQAGVQQAPADPFINGVLASALAERDVLLQNPSPTPGVEIF